MVLSIPMMTSESERTASVHQRRRWILPAADDELVVLRAVVIEKPLRG
jgi:hypothetical protein